MGLLFIAILSFLLFPIAAADKYEVNERGEPQPASRKVTFVNLQTKNECGLYFVDQGALALFYGPLPPQGGARTIEGFPGQVFVMVKVGTYERMAEFMIQEDPLEQRYSITDADVAHTKEPIPEASIQRERTAAACRQPTTCAACMSLQGCGWSVVRQGCFLQHPIATVSDKSECQNDDLPDPSSQSTEAWLNWAHSLVLDSRPPQLRKAFRALEGVLQEDNSTQKASALQLKRIQGALRELSAKLEAVFDDQDAMELLADSRHSSLAAIHPDMPPVERRTQSEATWFIRRGQPVVITDAFAHTKPHQSPVAHQWTLDYLSRLVFHGTDNNYQRFNVATDKAGRCCRYFEPQSKSSTAGYPYPHQPSTHLYRDTFDGYVKTVRKAARANRTTTLHYLHEIVMNAQGQAVVAGGPAPPQLVADLDAMKALLEPIAATQPFFGGFASAKVWMGQRGIVMPLHYDATDNLYVMAWGRKRAIIGPPGQLDVLYRYPNEHPLVGSSQVNLTSPDLDKYRHFKDAQLREVIVGPGDLLYLPAWWWHQFEQPFEDTAALNLWSRDREGAPDASLRDLRIREHALSDQLERSVVHLFGNKAGMVLEELATLSGNDDPFVATSRGDNDLVRANETLHAAAEQWREWVERLPGGHPKATRPAAQLVSMYLESHRAVMKEAGWPDWQPGTAWDLSQAAVLPRELRERCEPAPESSPFLSHCG